MQLSNNLTTMKILQKLTTQPVASECLYCGTPIHGRSDKKFCNHQCKNAYHNVFAHRMRKLKNNVLSSIATNYDVLTELLKDNIRTISIARISEKGFNTEVVTGYRRSHYHHTEERCFDIAYYRTSQKIFNIHRI